MKNILSNGGRFFIYGDDGPIEIGTADKFNVESEVEDAEPMLESEVEDDNE